MWDQGGQPWPQWPLSQQQWMQSFQHQQDPGQVDWAALAQAWIAQKESSGPTVEQPGLPPNGQDMQCLEVPPSNHGSFQGDPAFSRMWQPEWGMPAPPPEQPWHPPGPVDVVPPSEDSNSQDSVEFAHESHQGLFPQNSHSFPSQTEGFSAPPMPVNQFDYQHGAAAFAPPASGYPPSHWQQGPPQNRRERPLAFRDRPRSPVPLPVKQEPPVLDAVKRRTLPAWIREGLEKMDREKQKKLEKERMEKERAEMAHDQKKGKDVASEEGEGPRVSCKSKFDSDDENSQEEEDAVPVRKTEFERSPSPSCDDHSEPEMTEEEREFQLMVITKTLLTEVLLEVTTEEIYDVAKETHRKASKAPAKQLAQSSALASLTGLGGLGEYGSDGSEDERSKSGSESSDTDEEELRHRIRQKQDAFHRQEKAMLSQLEDVQGVAAPLTQDDGMQDRVDQSRGSREHLEVESSDKQDSREREGTLTVDRGRTHSEEVSSARTGKSQTGHSAGSASASPTSNSRSTSRSSSSRSLSSSSSSASSSSSSRSSSPRRKRRRSSASRRNQRRSRSHNAHRRGDNREKRQGSRTRSSERSYRRRNRSRSRDRTSRARKYSRDRRSSRERRRSSSRSRRKEREVSKDRDKRKDRSRSWEERKKKEKEADRKNDKQKAKDKSKDKKQGKESLKQEDSNGRVKRRRESELAEEKTAKKGSARGSKKYSDSESSKSRSSSPEASREKRVKKSKRSRSRSVEKSHKSGKKASRKHKSKSRSRSSSPTRRWR